jgi:hypothetical protein
MASLKANSKIESLKSYKNEDILNLIELGYTKQEIKDFTTDDIKELEGQKGELLTADEKYYRVTKEGTKEIKKEIALDEVKKFKEEKANKSKRTSTKTNTIRIASQIGSDTETKSWMKMITTVSVYTTSTGSKEYTLKNSFEWLTEPVYTLEDGIGLSHPEFMTQVQNSEKFRYSYDRHTNDASIKYVNTAYKDKGTADDKNSNGMAYKYDLLATDYYNGKKYICVNHRGYMLFKVTRSNLNYKQGAAYGHYTHSQVSLTWPTISVKIALSSLSVSGAMSKDKMTDTGVTFNF